MANTVAYTLTLLAMFPEYQEKAFEEFCAFFPKSRDLDVSYSDIKNLVYLDLILNESMRLLTPVPMVARQTMRDEWDFYSKRSSDCNRHLSLASG
ncbi:probable cytochrome P450 313a4 [Drosophila nasuta]|uniref:probable cytochrome P450 313a4 n=1 Tax=Drosophila nasuta TaxID=42062 RepID=UPI00295E5558|nr:probable cytochrome P450 313a4 [Drosophila nasuta]